MSEGWEPARVFIQGADGEETIDLYYMTGSTFRLRKQCERAADSGVLTLWDDIGQEVNIPWGRVIAVKKGHQ